MSCTIAKTIGQGAQTSQEMQTEDGPTDTSILAIMEANPSLVVVEPPPTQDEHGMNVGADLEATK